VSASGVEDAILAAEQLPVAIWMGRVPGGEVVYVNAAFREVLGLDEPPEAGRGGFVEPYGVHQHDGSPYPEARMPFERVLAARAPVVVDDLVIHRRDGRKVYLRVFAKPLFDGDGNITHVLEAFTDITREVEAERARAEGERKLARAQRLESIGQLVMGIAHDFNNLLTVTKLVVSQLRFEEREGPRRSALGDVEAVTDSAIALIKNLLGFSERSRHVLAELEVGAVVRSVVDLARRTFDKGITVRTEVEPGAWILGDRSQIEQVMMNLLVNARDAVGTSGTIVACAQVRELAAGEIEDSPEGTYVVIEVADDGLGIDPSVRDRMFEPYVTTKTFGPIKGTGLGLSTVHGIVRTHRGYVDAVDAKPRGTVVRAAIPSVPAPAERASVEPRPERRGREGRGALVLVVDDERLVREATVRALEAHGYRALEADGGARAIELFERHADEVDAVVLDVVMPGISADDVLREIERRKPGVKVLLVSGSAIEDGRAVLPKPFDEEQLVSALTKLGA
jgi:hypothetical protein